MEKNLKYALYFTLCICARVNLFAYTAYFSDFTNSKIVAVNTVDNSIITTIPDISSPAYIAITPNSHYLYASSLLENLITVIDTYTNSSIATIYDVNYTWVQ